jgi:hypothetical protein
VGYQEVSVKRSPAVEKQVLQPIRKGLLLALPAQQFNYRTRFYTDAYSSAIY